MLDILGTKVNKPGGIFSDGQTNVANWGSTEGSTREILAKAFGVQDEAALKGRAGVNLFLKLKNAPSVSVTDEYLPLPLRTRIREAYKGAFGKLPDARTTVYLAACMSEGDQDSGGGRSWCRRCSTANEGPRVAIDYGLHPGRPSYPERRTPLRGDLRSACRRFAW